MNRNWRRLLLTLASLNAIAVGTAVAQEAPEIVVSARRRDERLQDVPVAISAISGDSLASKSVQQILDLTRVVPGFTASQGGFGSGVPRFTIRGQVQFEQLISLDSSVGVYVGDVIQARAHGTNAGFFDLSSVEVLRGPQGTLFGRNTTGGAVLINPNTPTDNLEGYLKATVGNYRSVVTEGAVNVPLAAGLSLRAAGRVAKRRGYTYAPAADRYYDDENNQAWRLSLRWEPFENFSNIVALNGYHSNEYGSGWRLTETIPGTLFGNRTDVTAFLTGAGDRRIAGQSSSQKGAKSDVFGVSNTTTLDVGGVTLKNIFGYRTVDSESTNLDFDGTPIFLYDAPENLHQKQYSNEFQIFGTSLDGRLDWITGAYYFRETGDQTQRSTIVVTGQDLVRTGYVENISKSVFAQGTFKITPDLSFTAGGRYTWDQRALTQYGRNLLTNDCSSALAVLPECITPEQRAKFKSPTYTVSLDWKVAPDKLFYIAHRRGYRSGGFNLRANTAAQFRPFAPETVKDIEGGFKADWDLGGDVLLRTNIAAYNQWYTDIQRSVTFVDSQTNVLVTSVINAATANVSGFEAEMTLRPVRGLEITANMAHSRLRYKKFEQIANGTIQDLSANRIGFAPEWTGGGSIRYQHELDGNAGNLVVQADIYTQSKMQLQDLNVPGGIAQAYTLTNFRLEWNSLLGSNISAAAFVRNAFNKEHFTGGIAIGGFGIVNKNYGPPRTFGLELRIPFGG
jgi:iron complex outermembrane receptor protein